MEAKGYKPKMNVMDNQATKKECNLQLVEPHNHHVNAAERAIQTIMRWVQHCPYSPEPKKYGAKAQSPLPQDNSRKLTDKEIKQVQKIVGSILYYVRAVDMTILMALTSIASEQTKGTECTLEKHTKSLITWHHTRTQW